MNDLLEKIYANKFEEVSQILQNDISVFNDSRDYDKHTIFNRIISAKQFPLLDLLIDKKAIETDVYEYDTFSNSVFESIFKNLPKDEESFQYLKNFIGKFDNINDEVSGQTILSFALSEKASPEIIQTLIDAGCNPLYKNTAESNLLIESIRINMMPADRQLAYAKIFVDAGVDVNEGNVERKNALHQAIETHKKHLIPFLLEQGANTNDQDWKGNTAYHLAFADTDNDTIIPQLLDNQSPDFELENKEGEKPLAVFLRYMQGSEKSLQNLEKIIDAGADLDQSSSWYGRGKSGWEWIVEKKPEVLETVFTKVSPDANMQDNDGNTLLHKVCSIDCNYSQETAKDIYRKVKFLLKEGADASITNNKDETAMMIASKDNLKTKTVEILLNANK